jgi:hut operon positive regulator
MIGIHDKDGLGKIAVLLALAECDEEQCIMELIKKRGYIFLKGHVGTMDPKKIFSSIEVAAINENIIQNYYHEEHALYHAILEALNGYCRGQLGLDTILRSTGLTYSIVRGKLQCDEARIRNESKPWLAICLYGKIGSPRKGFEHDAIGLGVNSI